MSVIRKKQLINIIASDTNNEKKINKAESLNKNIDFNAGKHNLNIDSFEKDIIPKIIDFDQKHLDQVHFFLKSEMEEYPNEIKTKLLTSTDIDDAFSTMLKGDFSVNKSLDIVLNKYLQHIETFSNLLNEEIESNISNQNLILLNCSFGMNITTDILSIIANLFRNSVSTKLERNLFSEMKIDNKESILRDDLYHHLSGKLSVLLSSDKFTQKINELRETIQKAEKNNILVAASAGNLGYYAQFGENYPANILSQIPEVVVVGSVETNLTDDINDDYVPGFSAPKADFVYGGVDAIINEEGKTKSGTSFSVPKLIALLVECAKENPKLKATDLRRLVEDDFVADQIDGDFQGSGKLNSLEVRMLARDWDDFGSG